MRIANLKVSFTDERLAREQVCGKNAFSVSRATMGYVSEVDALRGLAMTGVVAENLHRGI
jgi:hypothetical protein